MEATDWDDCRLERWGIGLCGAQPARGGGDRLGGAQPERTAHRLEAAGGKAGRAERSAGKRRGSWPADCLAGDGGRRRWQAGGTAAGRRGRHTC